MREILNTPELEPTTLARNRRAQVDKRKRSADVVSMEAFCRRDESKKANVFDRLSKSFESSREKPLTDYPTVNELELDSRFDAKSRAQAPSTQVAQARSQILAKRESRKEQVPVYELADEAIAISPSQNEAENDADLAEQPLGASLANLAPEPTQSPELRVRFFESEIGPFNLEILDADHLVLFRNVWRAGERFIQGALIGRREFIDRTIEEAFRSASVSTMSDLLFAYNGDVVATYTAVPTSEPSSERGEFRGELLYRSRLSAPANAFELIFTVADLPIGQGARYLGWITLLLGLSLNGGCYVIYRYGNGQISLCRQQQDFVSAVSHELKTPLTLIRMYSEILKSGWASEEKKLSYYAFIHEESERLSRLIANVLQLSRMSRDNPTTELKAVTVGELLDVTCSKISSQLDGAGFALNLATDPDIRDDEVRVDTDAYTQIMINVIDNAIKFSPSDANKQIDLSCARLQDRSICFTVRDYGKGIQKNQMRKIFELFYRSENELTRGTVGTGIGLSLVSRLAKAMGGSVDGRNCNPGAEFSLTFPDVKDA
ncbi:MAG: signal transduction histidine kinase [Gammaproteobacteria bacterium]